MVTAALALFLSALLFLALALWYSYLEPRHWSQWLVLAVFFGMAVFDGVALVLALVGSWHV